MSHRSDVMRRSAPGRYLAFMLRLWLVDGESSAWHASLEDSHTGERRGFGNLELMFEFIKEQTSYISIVRSDMAKPADQPEFDSNN